MYDDVVETLRRVVLGGKVSESKAMSLYDDGGGCSVPRQGSQEWFMAFFRRVRVCTQEFCLPHLMHGDNHYTAWKEALVRRSR